MDKKEIFISWLRRFGLIHGFSMLMVYVICALVSSDAVFDVSFLGNMLIFSIAATLPGVIYYTSHEMSDREWWIRTGIHFVLLNILLLPISHAIGLWKGVGGFFIFIALILIVDILVHMVSFGIDWAVARDINKLLEQHRKNGNDHE